MYRIGFDVGGTNLKVGVVDDNMQIVARDTLPFPRGGGHENFISTIVDQVVKLAEKMHIGLDELESIGIAVPGSINRKEGMIIDAHNLALYKVPVVSEIEKRFPSIPILLANDADAAALGELYGGALVGKKTALLITLGTGVGGGIILGGRVFAGGLGHGNELGHMIIQQGGPVCTCGNRGCIESLCTATWLISQGRKAVVENPLSLIYEKSQGDMEKVTAKIVVDCAREGDAFAKDIFNTYLESLSSAIVSLAALLDPEVIALGGGVSLAGDYLFEPLRKLVKEKSFFKSDYKIVPAKLGNDAGIIGAARLYRDSSN